MKDQFFFATVSFLFEKKMLKPISACRVGFKIKQIMKDEEIYKDRASQIEAIDKTFERAKEKVTEMWKVLVCRNQGSRVAEVCVKQQFVVSPTNSISSTVMSLTNFKQLSYTLHGYIYTQRIRNKLKTFDSLF